MKRYVNYLKQRGDVTFTKFARSYFVEVMASEKQNTYTVSYHNSSITHFNVIGSKEASENDDPFGIGDKQMWPLLAFVIPAYAIVFLSGLSVFNRLSKNKEKCKR